MEEFLVLFTEISIAIAEISIANDSEQRKSLKMLDKKSKR